MSPATDQLPAVSRAVSPQTSPAATPQPTTGPQHRKDRARHQQKAGSPLLHQPLAVWAVAVACVFAFMGIGQGLGRVSWPS